MCRYLCINTCTWRMIATSFLLLTCLNYQGREEVQSVIARGTWTSLVRRARLSSVPSSSSASLSPAFLICKMRWSNMMNSKAISVLNILLRQLCHCSICLWIKLYHLSLGYFTAVLGGKEWYFSRFLASNPVNVPLSFATCSLQWVVTKIDLKCLL